MLSLSLKEGEKYCMEKSDRIWVRFFTNWQGKSVVELFGGHMVQDHVHMLIEIPPKYTVSEIVGYLKGKGAISVARQFGGRKRNFNGERLCARDCAVSTVGFEKYQIKHYIQNQEQLEGKGSDEEGDF